MRNWLVPVGGDTKTTHSLSLGSGVASPYHQNPGFRAGMWRYNGAVHGRCSGAVVLLCIGILAQTLAPSCPADRPVDDIITEVHKQQSKKRHRVANPFAQVTCIWSWLYSAKTTSDLAQQFLPTSIHGAACREHS